MSSTTFSGNTATVSLSGVADRQTIAIELDNVVGITGTTSKVFVAMSVLIGDVERWKEYRDLLQPLKKKPILFVMMNSTADADEVGDWLRKKYPGEFAGDKLLIIHTDSTGKVSKKDLAPAQRLAREVDEEASPVSSVFGQGVLSLG